MMMNSNAALRPQREEIGAQRGCAARSRTTETPASSTRRVPCPIVCSAALALTSALGAHADPGDQVFKLLPSDGATNDFAGMSVAISGTTVAVGAHRHDPSFGIDGAVYLFDTNLSVSSVTLPQTTKLISGAGLAVEEFGRSVALDGPRLAVGASDSSGVVLRTGAAYLYDVSNIAMPMQLELFTAEDGGFGDQLGWSVAISGDLVLAGATGDDDMGQNAGAAYVFDAGTGAQLAKLTPSDGQAGDAFGFSVAISGTRAIIGAPGNDEGGSGAGAAYLFDLETFEQLDKLLADDAAPGDRFGASVAINGIRILVGAEEDDGPASVSGSAYVFDALDGSQLRKLNAPAGTTPIFFGRGVALQDTNAIVGGYQTTVNGINSGAAFMFSTETGALRTRFVPEDQTSQQWFGFSVGVDAERVVIGSAADPQNGALAGSAYLFEGIQFPIPCAADFNGSGTVDSDDLSALLGAFSLSDAGDIDGNGLTDADDLGLLLAVFGQPCLS
ncbi:MAG: hypothetical protein ACTS3F_07785 [Phycisphaerales bacterium]